MSFLEYLKRWNIEWLNPGHKFKNVVYHSNYKKIPFKKGI